jgi:hypothetical protein
MPVTLEKIQKDLKDFPYDFQMYCYHEMNGRKDEAQSYLDAYLDMQKGMVDELKTVPKVEEVDVDLNDCIKVEELESLEEVEEDDDEYFKLSECKKQFIRDNEGYLTSYQNRDYCSDYCRGWDGFERRCECGNRRIYWCNDSECDLNYEAY